MTKISNNLSIPPPFFSEITKKSSKEVVALLVATVAIAILATVALTVLSAGIFPALSVTVLAVGIGISAGALLLGPTVLGTIASQHYHHSREALTARAEKITIYLPPDVTPEHASEKQVVIAEKAQAQAQLSEEEQSAAIAAYTSAKQTSTPTGKACVSFAEKYVFKTLTNPSLAHGPHITLDDMAKYLEASSKKDSIGNDLMVRSQQGMFELTRDIGAQVRLIQRPSDNSQVTVPKVALFTPEGTEVPIIIEEKLDILATERENAIFYLDHKDKLDDAVKTLVHLAKHYELSDLISFHSKSPAKTSGMATPRFDNISFIKGTDSKPQISLHDTDDFKPRDRQSHKNSLATLALIFPYHSELIVKEAKKIGLTIDREKIDENRKHGEDFYQYYRDLTENAQFSKDMVSSAIAQLNEGVTKPEKQTGSTEVSFSNDFVFKKVNLDANAKWIEFQMSNAELFSSNLSEKDLLFYKAQCAKKAAEERLQTTVDISVAVAVISKRNKETSPSLVVPCVHMMEHKGDVMIVETKSSIIKGNVANIQFYNQNTKDLDDAVRSMVHLAKDFMLHDLVSFKADTAKGEDNFWLRFDNITFIDCGTQNGAKISLHDTDAFKKRNSQSGENSLADLVALFPKHEEIIRSEAKKIGLNIDEEQFKKAQENGQSYHTRHGKVNLP